MSKYLVRLKSATQLPRELTKPTKVPFVSNVSTEDEPFSEIASRQPEDSNNQFRHHNARVREGGAEFVDVIKKARHAHARPREGDSEHYARVRTREASTDPPNPLAEESSKRFAFCDMHRRMLGQECHRQAVIDGRQSGNREAALNGCLLWQVVKAEPNLDRLAGMEVLEGVTVADCQAMLADCNEPPALFQRDRRWLLVFAGCIRNRKGLTTLKTLEET